MKRKLFSVSLLFVLALMLTCSVFAAPEDATYVYDWAELLSQEEWEDLQQDAQYIADCYGCSVYIATVEDYTYYAYDIFDAADEIYWDSDIGIDGDAEGLLLLLSMAERDYSLTAYGENTRAVFTSSRRSLVEEAFLDDFKENDWYSGMSDYLDEADALLAQAEDGTLPEEQRDPLVTLLLVVGVPLLITTIVCLAQKSKMKTAVKKVQAKEYIALQGVNFHVRTDRFTHVTTSRVRVQSKSGSSGSSSSTGSRGKF